ncbi:MAG TPA: SAM-dependent methyltransferase [Streptosporangiaceae bacterium]|nr:SAM-dependent methyltransferase [Streptosporangiaceae bacterium]
MTDHDQARVPPGVDPERADVARVYDYFLGGTHNFPADRAAAEAIIALEPNARAIGRANRAFLRRAVAYMAGAGVRQFLDIGSGIPTQGHVHEVAEAAAPGTAVVYADIDPVALAHSRALLAGTPRATIIEADLREPVTALERAEGTGLIDLGRPTGLLLNAVLHFIPDEADPWGIVRTLRDALAPGSYLALSHGSEEGKPEVAQGAEEIYRTAVSASLSFRSRRDIRRFFDGFDLIEPGLVALPFWRPPEPPDPDLFWGGFAGVGRKP